MVPVLLRCIWHCCCDDEEQDNSTGSNDRGPVMMAATTSATTAPTAALSLWQSRSSVSHHHHHDSSVGGTSSNSSSSSGSNMDDVLRRRRLSRHHTSLADNNNNPETDDDDIHHTINHERMAMLPNDRHGGIATAHAVALPPQVDRIRSRGNSISNMNTGEGTTSTESTMIVSSAEPITYQRLGSTDRSGLRPDDRDVDDNNSSNNNNQNNDTINNSRFVNDVDPLHDDDDVDRLGFIAPSSDCCRPRCINADAKQVHPRAAGIQDFFRKLRARFRRHDPLVMHARDRTGTADWSLSTSTNVAAMATTATLSSSSSSLPFSLRTANSFGMFDGNIPAIPAEQIVLPGSELQEEMARVMTLNLKQQQQQQQQDECVICMESFEPTNPRMPTLCGCGQNKTYFHLPCLYQWVEQCPDCPSCRQPLRWEEF